MSRGFYILVFFTILNILLADEGRANVKVYSTNDGLSQTSISCLFQDSEGYLWIGTQDGLNLYDGYSFRSFRYQPTDSTSLSGNHIMSISEDKDGFIWVGTDKGLNKLNKKNWFFRNYGLKSSTSNKEKKISVFDVFEDSQNQIWIKTSESIYYLNDEDGEFTSLYSVTGSPVYAQDEVSTKIVESESNILWVGTRDGLVCINPLTKEVSQRYFHKSSDKNSLSDNKVRCLLKDNQNNIWIGTSNGLNKYNKNKGDFKRIYPATGSNSVLSNTINFLIQLSDDFILLGTDKGIGKIRISDNKVLVQSVFEDYESQFRNNNYSKALIDKSNILWLGTIRGLVKKDLKKKKFNLFNEEKNSFPGIGSYDIASIALDSNRRLWLGTWGEGFSIIDKGKVKTFKTGQSNYNYGVRKNYVHSIFIKDEDEVWLGTRDGIVLFDSKSGITRDFCKVNSDIDCSFFTNARIYDFFKKGDNKYLIGTNKGLILYDEGDRSIEKYDDFETDTSVIEYGIVYCIMRDKNSNLWFGTNNGVIITDNSLKVRHHYYFDANRSANNVIISANDAFSIHEDNKGRVWVGTRFGLNLYLPQESRFKIITENDGLPNNLIYALHNDSHDNIWMSTNQGLVRLNPNNWEITSYNVKDGLQSTEFNLGASYKDPVTGKLFFGGISGLNCFHPDSILSNPYKPNVVITSVEFIDRDGTKRDFFSGDTLLETKTKSLINISYSALDFTYPEKNRYHYRLYLKNKKGGDNWLDAKNKNGVTLYDISPGHYIFQVKGANSDGVEGPSPATIEITVRSGIWESKTAYFLYAVMIIGLAYSFVHYRTRTLRKLNREYRERERINKQVQKQKEELALKNKNITDSINYAKRIQEAVMPSISTVKRILPNSFVLHMPKDIVSGDFYWVHEKADKVFIAAVDCTGHGVPGAFMSIIGFELFRKITNTQGIENPSDILNTLNADFAEIFRDVSDYTLRDGMDMAFCVFDKSSRILEFAGAFNPLYIIRDNKISEIKGDRFSVGIETFPEEQKIFKNHSIALEDDDMVFIFSDGYADQFGGPEGKKYKYRRFRHLLLTIHKLPLDVQRDLLQKSILEWKGDLDQVDDVLVIGFKPLEAAL